MNPHRQARTTEVNDEAKELIAKLDALTQEQGLLKHPFYQAWNAGTLAPDRLRHYAVQYYRHVEAFPRYLSTLHSRCENLETRQALLENLIEEERGEGNHPELWLRFAEALGVTRQEVAAATAQPATRELVDTFMELARQRSLEAGLASLYVYEAQFPAVATTKIDGLKRHYGVSDPRGLAFFEVHRQADVEHARTTAELIERHCIGAEQAEQALAGAREAVTALWRMLDSV